MFASPQGLTENGQKAKLPRAARAAATWNACPTSRKRIAVDSGVTLGL
jgi:hypothetical protein